MTRLEQLIEAGEIDARLIEPGVPTPTVPDAAAALGVQQDQIIKSLLFAARDGRVVLAVVTGSSRVDRHRLADVANLGHLKMAAPQAVLQKTGYPAGGTPPVGHISPLTVVVDTAVMRLPVAFGGGGRVDSLLEIKPAEILRVTQATVADIVLVEL